MTVGVVLLWLVAIAIAFLLGYFITSLLWPRELNRALILPFAAPVGLGACSLIFFVFRRPMFTVEIGLLLLGAWLMFRRRDRESIFPKQALSLPWGRLTLGFVLAVALGWGLSGMIQRIDRMPHGDWDAWAIWNSHSRYLYRDGPSWKENIKNTFHPDYPLLTASLTARLWRYSAKEEPDAGGLIGLVFTLSGLAVLFATLADLKSVVVATLFGLVLITTPFYLEHGVSQSADVPLGIYVLCTVSLICLHLSHAPRGRGLLVLAGFCAGLAAWTKNEGLVVVAGAAFALAVSGLLSPRKMLHRLSPFLAGLLVPLAVALFFKFTVAPSNDIFGDRQLAEFIAKILDPSRYETILGTFAQTSFSFGGWSIHPIFPMLAFIGLRGIDRFALRGAAWLTSVLTLFLVLAAYFAVYLITPMDLRWHLDSSLPRLLLHLWPSFLLVFALGARLTPAEAQA